MWTVFVIVGDRRFRLFYLHLSTRPAARHLQCYLQSHRSIFNVGACPVLVSQDSCQASIRIQSLNSCCTALTSYARDGVGDSTSTSNIVRFHESPHTIEHHPEERWVTDQGSEGSSLMAYPPITSLSELLLSVTVVLVAVVAEVKDGGPFRLARPASIAISRAQRRAAGNLYREKSIPVNGSGGVRRPAREL